MTNNDFLDFADLKINEQKNDDLFGENPFDEFDHKE